MKLTSPAFNHNQNIPSKFTCDGEGVSPALVIFDVPKEAQSLALVVDDPDAMKALTYEIPRADVFKTTQTSRSHLRFLVSYALPNANYRKETSDVIRRSRTITGREGSWRCIRSLIAEAKWPDHERV